MKKKIMNLMIRKSIKITNYNNIAYVILEVEVHIYQYILVMITKQQSLLLDLHLIAHLLHVQLIIQYVLEQLNVDWVKQINYYIQHSHQHNKAPDYYSNRKLLLHQILQKHLNSLHKKL
jgi:hypothetical protein